MWIYRLSQKKVYGSIDGVRSMLILFTITHCISQFNKLTILAHWIFNHYCSHSYFRRQKTTDNTQTHIKCYVICPVYLHLGQSVHLYALPYLEKFPVNLHLIKTANYCWIKLGANSEEVGQVATTLARYVIVGHILIGVIVGDHKHALDQYHPACNIHVSSSL